jgi:hypothetical protein
MVSNSMERDQSQVAFSTISENASSWGENNVDQMHNNILDKFAQMIKHSEEVQEKYWKKEEEVNKLNNINMQLKRNNKILNKKNNILESMLMSVFAKGVQKAWECYSQEHNIVVSSQPVFTYPFFQYSCYSNRKIE